MSEFFYNYLFINSLISPQILQYPNFQKEFIPNVDASKEGIGAVLSQLSELGEDLPIAFASSAFAKFPTVSFRNPFHSKIRSQTSFIPILYERPN